MELRPHILKWTTAGTPGGDDPETGYPLPGTPGDEVQVSCRFRLGGVKVFKNEDSTETAQIGTIRVDIGSQMPLVGQSVQVIGDSGYVHFSGTIRDVYKGGQLISWRMDV